MNVNPEPEEFPQESPTEIAPLPPPPRKLTTWQKILASKFLVVSIAVHLLFGAGAAVYVVHNHQAKRVQVFKGGPPSVNPSSRALEHKVSMAKKKASMSAPAQAKRISVAGALSKVALPEIITMPSATTVTPNRMGGIGGNGMGMGIGGLGGSGSGAGGFPMPQIMGDRCSVVSRATAMRTNGGNQQCEDAIIKGLRWLKTQQNADGSWGQEYPAAMTGLALLSFLGHCERPSSKEFGPNVRKAIDYLVALNGPDGMLARAGGHPAAYEHGIATYALGEAYILTREPKVAEVFKTAVGKIVYGQSPDGGWSYGFSKGKGDTSVSGWQVQSLKVAKLSGLGIAGVDDALKKAAGNILRVRGPKGGFGYTDPGDDKPAMTAVGILVLQMVNQERGQVVRQALDLLVDRKDIPPLSYGSANLYMWYYATQACFQHRSSSWAKWNREFQPELLKNQASDGSWNPTSGDLHSGGATTIDGQVYRTSVCILMLEVYYRYLASNR
jgi:hypothetical protein